MEFEKVYKNEYGYYELKKKPTYEEREEEFQDKYFQESMSSYETHYSDDELLFFKNKLEQKRYIIEQQTKGTKKRFLDIGCGEGFALQYFHDCGYDVSGMDFSKYGVMTHNPMMVDKVFFGDCYKTAKKLIKDGKKFDIINMDAVLDMVLDPEGLVDLCWDLLEDDGILFVKVANNYSNLQLDLLDKGKLSRDFWLDESGHPSYFNKDGLIAMIENHRFKCVDFIGDSFIDFNLVNENTNYYEKKEVGKSCYLSKVYLENDFHQKSMEKAVQIYRLLGEMGYGREIMGVFKK